MTSSSEQPPMEIPLSQGKVALIDPEDYEKVSGYQWCAHKDYYTFYVVGRPKGKSRGEKQVKMHRLILNAPAGMEIDHIDGNGLNNQKSNIRIVDSRGNHHNIKRINKSSQYSGVCWSKNDKRWRSQIKIGGKKHNLGSFDNEFTAFQTYVVATVVLVGVVS